MEKRDFVIKTNRGYVSVNFPNNKNQNYMYTSTMAFARRYTKPGARAIMTRFNLIGEIVPYEVQGIMTDEEFNEIIDR